MKKQHILIAVAILAATSSCQEFLDTSLDTNQTTQTLTTDRNSIWGFANAFYAPLHYGYDAIDGNILATAFDEAQQAAPASDVMYLNKGMINANVNPLAYRYANCYEGIRAANYFLDYVADGKGKALLAQNRNLVTDAANYQRDLQSLDWYIAEAHIAKAYYYSELIKMYGGVPLITDDASAPQRASYDECMEYIVSEIDTWKDKLATDWHDYADREGRFTIGAALAIKARTLLYAASPLHNPTDDNDKWVRAAQAANELLQAPDLAYSLHPDYGAYFKGETSLTSSETIFLIRREPSNNLEKANYPIATPGGNSGACPTENLVSQYEYIGQPLPDNPYANRDPRLAATVVTNGSQWNGRNIAQAPGETDDMAHTNASPTGYYLKKFLTDELNLIQAQTAQHNWVAYRYAEVLLNYAEAMNEAFGPDNAPQGYAMTAREALQKVRDRASVNLPAVTATTIETFRNAVKHERQLELAFEDHRYWDLLRWKDAMTVLNKPVSGVKVSRAETGYAYTVAEVAPRVFYERNYYLPFMRSELENSNGTLVQNPKY